MKRITKYMVCIALATGFCGCSDSYMDNEPQSSISSNELTKSADALDLLMEGLNGMMYSYYFGSQFISRGQPAISMLLDMLTDDFVSTKKSKNYKSYYNWEDHTSKYGDLNYCAWDYYSTLIQHANEAITDVEILRKKNGDMENKRLDVIEGEAHAFRAWCNFNLVRLFGKRYVKGEANDGWGVILREKISYDQRERSTVAETYDFILNDMKIALEKLKGQKSKRKNRLRYPVALTIAANIALTMQDYPQAEEYAKLALKELGKEADFDTPEQVLQGYNNWESKEWIWAYHQSDSQDYGFSSWFATYSCNFNTAKKKNLRFAINRDIYDKMGENDVRRKLWVCMDQPIYMKDNKPTEYFENILNRCTLTNSSGKKSLMIYWRGGITKPYWETSGQHVKFWAASVNISRGDLPIMRLPEIYYILAEAQARQGKDNEAAATLIKVVKPRDPEYTTQLTGEELITEIFRNKRIEFWGEGLRFYDMKRTGIGTFTRVNASNITKYTPKKAYKEAIESNSGIESRFLPKSIDDPVWQFAIPNSEIKGNKKCQLNELRAS